MVSKNDTGIATPLLGAVQPTRVIVLNYLERRNLLAKTGRCAPTTTARR